MKYRWMVLLMTVSITVAAVGCRADDSLDSSSWPQDTSASQESSHVSNTSDQHTGSSSLPASASSSASSSSSSLSSSSHSAASSTSSQISNLSPEDGAKRINNRAEGVVVKLASERSVVYQPTNSWGYSHHAAMHYFKGKYYAVFSNGKENEDDCGQRIMLSVSSNCISWSKPAPLVDSVMGKSSQLVLVNAGVYNSGKALVVYYGSYEYRPESLRGENLRPLQDASRMDYTMWMVSTTDGTTWSKPKMMTIPFGCNYGPLPLKSGRLLMSGGTTFPYTDDSSGMGTFFTGTIRADSAIQRGAKTITEGSFFQTDDGVIHMMLRSNNKLLWSSESRNDGVTWSEPYPTGFTDDNSKFQFGRLPDGRFFYVGNPYPGSGRNPLVLCLSSDGVNFNQQYILRDERYTQQIPGLYKSGVYGYPSVLIQDGYMCVIYSKHKEVIEVTRFPLSALK